MFRITFIDTHQHDSDDSAHFAHFKTKDDVGQTIGKFQLFFK